MIEGTKIVNVTIEPMADGTDMHVISIEHPGSNNL